jgi:hypothetical protein
MSFEITTAFVQQYRDNVLHLAQQKGSRLRSTVKTTPDIVGQNYYFERIGATGVRVKQGRHSPTPLISTPHSRRRVSMVTYNWGEAVDNDDKLKVLINPESEYVQAAQSAFGRNMDDIIIAAILGTSKAGTDGATDVAFPTTGGPLTTGQYVTRTAINNDSTLDAGTTDSSSLSPQRMRQIKFLFDAQDVDPDEERYAVVSAGAIKNMLSHVQVTSADYNTVKALAEGAIDTYMGFKFILSNRLPIVGTPSILGITYPAVAGTISSNGDRLCLFYTRSGIGLAMQEDVKTEVAKDPSLSFSTRIYMEMVMGATRVEEARVVVAPVVEL